MMTPEQIQQWEALYLEEKQTARAIVKCCAELRPAPGTLDEDAPEVGHVC
jgi:hypothetical protein